MIVPWEEIMAFPKIVLRGKKVTLLNGFRAPAPARGKVAAKLLKIQEAKQLRQSARRNPDAVAFGFVAGKWTPAA